jgi:hypothetical protein
MEPKRRYAPPAPVLQELEIVERAPAAAESREDGGPPGLALEAVRELDVRVRERGGAVGRELFEPEDRGGVWGAGPGVVWDERAARAFFFWALLENRHDGDLKKKAHVSYSESSKMR